MAQEKNKGKISIDELRTDFMASLDDKVKIKARMLLFSDVNTETFGGFGCFLQFWNRWAPTVRSLNHFFVDWIFVVFTNSSAWVKPWPLLRSISHLVASRWTIPARFTCASSTVSFWCWLRWSEKREEENPEHEMDKGKYFSFQCITIWGPNNNWTLF